MYKKLETGNSEEFTLVHAKPSGSSEILLNPLYNTLIAIQKTPKSLIKKEQLLHKDTKNGGVFYISLAAPIHQLFNPNFQFNECHLTINQYYKNEKSDSNNGLATIHYTETYVNKKNKANIIVHVYFSKKGFFQHIQTKFHSTDSSPQKHGEEITLSIDETLQIRENIKDPARIIGQLIAENYLLYTKSVDDANSIDKELGLLSINPKKGVLEEYIKKADFFIKAVDTINLFSYENKDKRGEWMTSQIENIKKRILDFKDDKPADKLPSTEKNSCTTSKAESTIVTAKQFHDEQTKKQYCEIEILEKNIANIESQLKTSSRNIPLLIQHSQLLAELNLHLLFISSTSPALNKQQKNYLQKLNTSTHKKNNLLDIFFDFFWEGDLEAIQALYPLTGHLISAKHILNMLCKLAEYKPEAGKEKKLKETINFLYEKSSTYQFLMHATTVMLQDPESLICSSLLIKTYFLNNFFAFQIFLEQGVHPDSMGVSHNGWQLPSMFLICTHTVDHDPLPFLQLAIQHGAHYTAKPAPIDIDERRTPKATLNYFNKSNKNTIIKLFHDKCDNSLIQECCETKNNKILGLFIPQMSFEDILEALGRLLNRQAIFKRTLMPSLQHDCMVVTDFNTIEKTQEKIRDYKGSKRLCTILIHGKDEPDCLILIEKLLNALKLKIHSLAKNSPDKWDFLQQKTLHETRDVTSKTSYKLESCILVLMLTPKPTFMTYQSLMQLWCRKAAYAAKKSLYNQDIASYHGAKMFAEKSCFSSELMQTPLYAFILKKLDTLNSNGEAPSFIQTVVSKK